MQPHIPKTICKLIEFHCNLEYKKNTMLHYMHNSRVGMFACLHLLYLTNTKTSHVYGTTI